MGGEAAQICVLQHCHRFVFFSSAATLSSVPDGGCDLCVSRPPRLSVGAVAADGLLTFMGC